MPDATYHPKRGDFDGWYVYTDASNCRAEIVWFSRAGVSNAVARWQAERVAAARNRKVVPN